MSPPVAVPGILAECRLAEVLRIAREAMAYIDEMGAENSEMPEGLIPAFRSAALEIQMAVDCRIMTLREIDARSSMLTALSGEITEKLNVLSRAKAMLLARTHVHLMDSNVDFPRGFEGTLGRLRLQTNGGVRAIEYKIAFGTVADTVNEADAWTIPEEYLKTKTVRVFDKERFDADLRADKISGGNAATLKERGRSVRYK